MQSLSGEKKTNYQQPGGYNQQRRTAQNNVEPIPVVFVPRADYSTRPAVCCHSGQGLNVTDHYRFPNVNSEKEGWLCVSASDCLLCSDFMMGPSFHSTYYYMRVFCWLLCYDFREGLPRCYLPIFQAKGYWSYPRPARNTLCAMGAGERTPWTRHRYTHRWWHR